MEELLEQVLESDDSDLDDDLDDLCMEDEFFESADGEDRGPEEELTQESDSDNDHDTSSPPPKRPRTSLRLVNSIDAALEEDNYEPMDVSGVARWTTWKAKLGPKKSKTAETITWTDEPPEDRGRQRQCDTVKEKQAPRTREARSCKTPREVFDLFITRSMVDTGVQSTNKRIQETINKLGDALEDDDTKPFVRTTDAEEIYALFGLFYFRGLLGVNLRAVHRLFSDRYGHPVFGGTMSLNRFSFLSGHLCFDDPSTRRERWVTDRFAAFRNIFEEFNDNCSKHLIPSEYLSMDETLYPMRTRIAFRQYNPSKPATYGLLFKSLNDARVSYTYRSLVYAGKPQQLPAQHYVSGNENYVKGLIEAVDQKQGLQGRNLSMDRLYTSINLAQWLLQKRMTCIGTMQQNRVGIPEDLKKTNDRELLSTRQLWEKTKSDLVLTSYVVSSSKGKKNVLVLSTTKPLQGVTRDDGCRKPAVIKLYDFTKGGTDNVDQRIAMYSTRTKSAKWTRSALSFVLDTARVNSATLFAIATGVSPHSIDSFEFAWDLANSLVLPLARSRPVQGLPNAVQLKLSLLLGPESAEVQPPKEQTSASGSTAKRRCTSCVENLVGKAEYKDKKSKLKKIKTVCSKCQQPCCTEHLVSFCPDCAL